MKHTPTVSGVPITSHIFHGSKSDGFHGQRQIVRETKLLIPRLGTVGQRNPLESSGRGTDIQLSSPSSLQRLALQEAAAMIQLAVFFHGSKLNEFHQLRHNLAKIGFHTQSIRQLRQNVAPSSADSRAEKYRNRPEHFSGTARHGG